LRKTRERKSSETEYVSTEGSGRVVLAALDTQDPTWDMEDSMAELKLIHISII